MYRGVLAAFLAAGVLATAPAFAQPAQQQETVPVQMSSKQVTDLQQKLKQQGFYNGQIDGKWGPETQTAVKDFQKKEDLPVTGQLDPQTMQKLGIQMNEGTTGSSTSGNSGSSSSGSAGASQEQHQ